MRYFEYIGITLLFVSSCRCQEPTIPSTSQLEWLQESSVTVDGSRAETSMGRAVFGKTIIRRIVFRNSGRAIAELNLTGGDGGVLTATLAQRRIAPGEQVAVAVVFVPNPADAPLRDYSAEFQINSLTLRIRATGVAEACELPDALDFGAVRIGESRQSSLKLRNTTALPVDSVWASPRPESLSATFMLSEPAQSATIPPESDRLVHIDFRPANLQEYLGAIDVRLSPECPLQAIRLAGRGVLEYLTWQPSPLDCGHVPLGTPIRRVLTFFNASNEDVTLNGLASSSQEFVVRETQLVVRASSTASIEVECQPQALGQRSGRLEFTTSLSSQPAGTVELRATGGGPDIDVAPSVLNFGRVALVQGGATTSRRVRISNVGSPGIGALHVRQPTLSSMSSDWDIGPLSNYDVDAGLAAAVGEASWFDVRLRPTRAGSNSAVIEILSNDVDEPIVQIAVTAMVEDILLCNLAIVPGQLDFGVVRPNARATLPIVLTNTSPTGTECFLSSVDTTGAGFSLVGGRRDTEILSSGASSVLTIQFDAPDMRTPVVEGTLGLEVSTPGPPREIPLRAAVFDSCVTIQPNPARWPDTPVSCLSEQDIVVYNTCSFPISLIGATIVTDAGWHLAQQPDAGHLVAAAENVGISAAFAPSRLAGHTSQLRISYTEGLPTVQSQIVQLAGDGVSGAPITERYFAPVDRQADYIICGSISTDDTAEDNLALHDFYDGLIDAGVDFHLIRVMEYWDYSAGEETDPLFVRPPPLGSAIPSVDGGAPSIFTPTVGDWETLKHVMRGPVGVGGRRHCLESVRRALRLHSDGLNAGFRRPNAPLNVLLSGNDDDASSTVRPPPWFGPSAPLSFYKSELLSGMNNTLALLRISAGATLDPSSPCAQPDGGPSNPRHREVVSWTGGTVVDFCQSSLDGLYDQFLALSLTSQRRFPLRAEPLLTAPFDVRVDGGSVPWTWIPQGHYIELAQPPPPGSPVDITYTPACIQ